MMEMVEVINLAIGNLEAIAAAADGAAAKLNTPITMEDLDTPPDQSSVAPAPPPDDGEQVWGS